MDCLFCLCGCAPNQHQLETRFVNGYCDEILFTADGHFVNLSPFISGVTVYLFHFEDCIPCSSVEEFKGVYFSKKPPPIYIQLLKMEDNFFTLADFNPGRVILWSSSTSNIKWNEKEVVIKLETSLLQNSVPILATSFRIRHVTTNIQNNIEDN